METIESVSHAKFESGNIFTHVIDWDKINTLEDVIEILKGLDIKIDPKQINPRLKPFITPISC